MTETRSDQPSLQLASCQRFLAPLRRPYASERYAFIYKGEEDTTLLCLHRGTGAVHWSIGGHDAGFAFLSPFFAGEGKLFISREDGRLYAIEEGSGAVLWTFAHESLLALPIGLWRAGAAYAVREPRPTTGAAPITDHPYRQTPALYQAPTRSSLCATDTQGRILEISAESGSLLREGKLGARLAAGCADEDALFLLDMDGALSCLDAYTWQEKWQRPFLNPKSGLFLLTQDALILQESDHTLSAFSRANGHPRWMSTLSCESLLLPSPSARRLFALSRSGALLTVDLSSGGSQMLASCPGARSIAAAGPFLYVDFPEEVGIYDAATGAREGTLPAPGAPKNTLFAEGDQIFAFREEEGGLFLYAFRLSSRQCAWKSRL